MNSLKKRKNIDFEILIYFDYIEGKILKCKLGSETNVKLKFDENEFKGKHVASIHNHTKDMTHLHLIKILAFFQENGKILN